jgi:hypothetical protein
VNSLNWFLEALMCELCKIASNGLGPVALLVSSCVVWSFLSHALNMDKKVKFFESFDLNSGVFW